MLTGNQLTITWRLQMRSTMNICSKEAFHETDKGYSLENGKRLNLSQGIINVGAGKWSECLSLINLTFPCL